MAGGLGLLGVASLLVYFDTCGFSLVYVVWYC